MPSKPGKRPVNLSGLRVVQDAQSRNRDSLRESQASAARNAVSQHDVRTVGVGDLDPPNIILFAMPFLEEPQFSYGSAYIPKVNISDWYYPFASAMVLSWARDPKGAYIGVRMAYHVGITSRLVTPPATYPLVELKHMLSFNGLAYKPISIPTGDVSPIRINF